MNKVVYAADVGGTNIRLAAVTERGDILGVSRRQTPFDLSAGELVELLIGCTEELGSTHEIRPVGMGIGVPANVGPDNVLRHLPNIPSLEGADIIATLSEKLGLHVVLENDAIATCIGEAWLGASRGTSTSIMVTLGTGVGGGIIVNGEALRGPDGGAGKIGHICVEPEGHPCGCGSRGCIEQYASATALARMANEAGIAVGSSLDLFERFESGDLKAAGVFHEMGRYLGITVGGLVNTFNPDVIVIGGGVAAAWNAFIDPLVAEIRYRAFSEPAARARVVRSTLADNAGILGAARSAFDGHDVK
jgi:glucokinase